MGRTTMDEQLSRILAAQVSDAELVALVAEAKAAAMVEVRERLRHVYVEQILGRLAEAAGEPWIAAAPDQGSTDLAGPDEGSADLTGPDPDTSQGEAPCPEPVGDADVVAAELAALRARLAANQSWLAGAPDAEPSELSTAGKAEASHPDSVALHECQGCDASARPAQAPYLLEHAPLLWLYAVRRAEGEGPVGAIGSLDQRIDGVAPGEPLRAVACGDLEAIVSEVPSEAFGEEALAMNGRDLAWLEPVARAHQQALAALLPLGPLVPMRLATIFAGPERIATMVAERADELRAALAYLDGRGEWGVQLFVDEAALAARLVDASPAVRELHDAIAARPAGTAYMLQRRLERLATEEACRVSDACANAAHAGLTAASVAAERSPVREAPGETMLLNGAYLVADADYPAFAAALAGLQAEHAPLGFRLQLTGPWPPYTFAAQGVRASTHD